MVSELGFGSAIVVLRGLSDDEVAQINTISLLSGVAAFALSCALAVPLGHYFHAPNLPPVLFVLGTTFVIASLRAVPLALLQRELQFRQLAVRDSMGAFVAAAVAIALAEMGYRYWALAWSQVASTAVVLVLTLTLRSHRFMWPQWKPLRHVLTFSNRMVIGRLSWYVYSNADFFVAGRRLGQVALGGYTFGWTLTSLPVDKITALIGGITPAFFSAVQDDRAQLRRYLLMITEGLALLSIPASIGIGLTARELVPAVFGRQWVGVVPVVQVLCLYAAIRTVRPVLNNVLTVVGETRMLMWQGIVSAIVFPLGFWFGSRWGPVGIATVWTVIYPFQFWWGIDCLFRTGVVSRAEYLRALWPAVSGTLVMCVVVLAARALLPAQLSLLARALLEVAVGATAFGAATWLVHRERVMRVLRVLRNLRAGAA
jgi:PST family polysaccharide transporter